MDEDKDRDALSPLGALWGVVIASWQTIQKQVLEAQDERFETIQAELRALRHEFRCWVAGDASQLPGLSERQRTTPGTPGATALPPLARDPEGSP